MRLTYFRLIGSARWKARDKARVARRDRRRRIARLSRAVSLVSWFKPRGTMNEYRLLGGNIGGGLTGLPTIHQRREQRRLAAGHTTS